MTAEERSSSPPSAASTAVPGGTGDGARVQAAWVDHEARRQLDERVAAGTARLGPADAGEVLTLQLAAWVREAHDNHTLAIPALHETLDVVQSGLGDPRLLTWVHRAPPPRRRSPTSSPGARTLSTEPSGHATSSSCRSFLISFSSLRWQAPVGCWEPHPYRPNWPAESIEHGSTS